MHREVNQRKWITVVDRNPSAEPSYQRDVPRDDGEKKCGLKIYLLPPRVKVGNETTAIKYFITRMQDGKRFVVE